MTMTIIREIVELAKDGWRPFNPRHDSRLYQNLACAHAGPGKRSAKSAKRPVWFARGDIFVCLGCEKKCCLSRPGNLLPPAPVKYSPPHSRRVFELSPRELARDRPFLQAAEAAYCLNVSMRTIYEWISQGKLKRLRLRPVRIDADDVRRMMRDFDE